MYTLVVTDQGCTACALQLYFVPAASNIEMHAVFWCDYSSSATIMYSRMACSRHTWGDRFSTTAFKTRSCGIGSAKSCACRSSRAATMWCITWYIIPITHYSPLKTTAQQQSGSAYIYIVRVAVCISTHHSTIDSRCISSHEVHYSLK